MKSKIYKVGLACMRLQPFHTGHARLIDRMLDECERVYLLIGSADKEGTEKNPIPYLFRKRLVENHYTDQWLKNQLHILPAVDINNLPKWTKHLLDIVPEVVDTYYAGTEEDALAFRKYPAEDYPPVKVIVHEREGSNCISATDIRSLFNRGFDTWKLYIPKDNIELTERVLKGLHPFPELEKLEKEMGGELE